MRKRKYGVKIVAFITLAAMMFSLMPANIYAADYGDMKGHWAETQISSWIEEGLASGYSDSTFRPDREVTRAEFSAFIHRAFKLPEGEGSSVFRDVSGGDWHYGYVSAGVNAGIFSGYPDGTFKPNEPVTRQETAVIISRLLGLEVPDVEILFTDKGEIPEWALDSVTAVYAAGIVNGYPDSTFRPKQAVTRAESIVTLDRALDVKASQEQFPQVTPAETGSGSSEGSGGSGGSSSSNHVTEITVGTGDEAELAAALGNKRIKTINITGEISGNFTASVDGQTINGAGSIISRNKLTGTLTVTAGDAEVKNLIVQGDLSVSGSGNDISSLNVAGDVLLKGNDNHLIGITIVGYYTDEGNGNILDDSNVTSNSPGGDLVLVGEGAELKNTKIKNRLVISGSKNSVIGGSAGSAEVAGSENVIFKTVVRGNIHVTGNNNQIVDSSAKGGYSDSGQGNRNDYTEITVDLPETVYMSVYETKRIEPRVLFPSEIYVIESAASRDEAVAKASVSNSVYQSSTSPGEMESDTAEAVHAEVYGRSQVRMGNELTVDTAEAVYTEVYGVSSGATYVDITVRADGYESVTKTIRVYVDVPVTGWVSGFEPISAASLTFYDTDGSVICETGPVTTEQGSFFTVIKDLLSDFRVTAHGGTNAVSGTPFTDVLIADYRNFDPDNDTIYINIGSSIVSACLDETPGISPEEAEGNIKRFFELPEWVDLFRELEKFSADGYFDFEAFLAEAEENGGLEQYIAQLAEEMPSTGTLPYGRPKMQVVATLGMKIGGALAEQAIGWGLRKAGVGFEATTEAQLAAIQNQLNDIKKDLKAMNDKMDHLYGELSRQITENGYDTRVGQLGGLTSSIRSIMDDLAVLVTMKNAAPSVRENFRQAIIRRIENNIINAPYMMHDQLMGVAGQESLLKVWSRVIKSRYKFLSSRDYTMIREQFDYFNGMQACMMLLRVEYYNAMGADAAADNALEAYRENIEAQSALLKEPVPRNMLIDRDQNIMIDEGDYFDYNLDGKWIKTKAPLYLRYWEAGDKIAEWNAANHEGYNNWRLFTRDELGKLCANRGRLVPKEYLSSQGWVSPLPYGMYFADQYELTWCSPWYWTSGNIRTYKLNYEVYEISNGNWHDIEKKPVLNQRGDMSVPKFHSPIVRTMEKDELSKYFW